jgi:hypothetical protein
MDKALKPERFTTLPTSSTATTDWKHWYHTFTNFLSSISSSKTTKCDRFRCLINCISSSIYNFIADCSDYDSAITILRDLYERKSNPICARYTLSSRHQAPNETIDEYIINLQLLARECDYKSVTADEHRQEAIRDAFISGIISSNIRLRLLESSKTSLNDIISLSRTLELAYKDTKSAEVVILTTF